MRDDEKPWTEGDDLRMAVDVIDAFFRPVGHEHGLGAPENLRVNLQRRIHEMIESRARLDLASCREMQLDVTSLRARECRAAMIAAFRARRFVWRAISSIRARVEALIARLPRSARLTFADIELDEDTHEVWKAGEPVSLSPTEFTLLRYFVINAGTVLSKPKILDHVWRYDFGGDVNVVESYVSYLRRKIDTGEKRLLHTLKGGARMAGRPFAPVDHLRVLDQDSSGEDPLELYRTLGLIEQVLLASRLEALPTLEHRDPVDLLENFPV